jgi:hypothetical protein
MADENVTLDSPAPDEGQPVDQAIDSTPIEATDPPADDPAAATLDQPRLYAGKYKTVEELEASYQSSQSEASRMASELAATRRAPTPTVDEKPKYSQEQLETWKESRLQEVASNHAKAERLQAEGNFQAAQQHLAQAQESSRQIRLIDGELRSMAVRAEMQTVSKQSAEQTLMKDANAIIQTYASDLVPGTTLYEKAAEFLGGYGNMGMDVKSPLVQAQAVAMAAQVLGLSSKKIAQTTRKELSKTIQTNLKAATVSGGGKSIGTASGPDFKTMSKADFAKYKRERGWD